MRTQSISHSTGGGILVALTLWIAGCGGGGGLDLDELCDRDAATCTPLDDDGGQVDDGPAADDAADDGPAADDDGDTGEAPAGGIPCDVLDVLRANCQGCHGEPPSFGAPMSLMDFDDLHVPAVTDPTRKVHDVVAERLVDDVVPMPPGGTMADGDRDLLLDWIAAGAPEDPEADCAPASDDGGDDGEEELPCGEPDLVLTAHASGSEEPFAVPAVGADNLYMCFAFQAPFDAPTHATAWAPIIDDERVVHHWILYKTKAAQTVGSASLCDVSLQLTTQFVAGWAPGGGNVVMPDDVGLELGGPDDWYILQIHYNNTAHHADAIDKSGVGFCTAEEPRPNTAGVLTLGSVGITIPPLVEDFPVTGTCSPLATALWPEMHVMGASAHMHQLGRSMRSEVRHLDGSTELILDAPAFDFNSQGMYMLDPEVVVRPGDSITTRCTYDNPNPWPVVFGERSEDEMCFDFVLAYPIDALLDRNCGIVF